MAGRKSKSRSRASKRKQYKRRSTQKSRSPSKGRSHAKKSRSRKSPSKKSKSKSRKSPKKSVKWWSGRLPKMTGFYKEAMQGRKCKVQKDENSCGAMPYCNWTATGCRRRAMTEGQVYSGAMLPPHLANIDRANLAASLYGRKRSHCSKCSR